MTHPEFFSRLVTINSMGPNVNSGDTASDDIERRWVCGNCDSDHGSEKAAEDCCQPDVYRMWKCPSCGDLHEVKGEAQECCSNGRLGACGQPLQCPVCMRLADSFEEATDCCLHTHPTMTAYGRQCVARLVEGGMPWAEAIARNVHH